MWLFIGDEDEVLPAATTDLAFASALPAGLALSRADATLARSRTDGRWISYPADTARPDIDPITLESRGTLVEPSRSQLVFKSRTPGYTPVLATSVTDATIQTPFGLSALKLTPTSVAGFHGFNLFYGAPASASAPVADGTTIAIHLVFRPVGNFPNINCYLQGRDGVYKTVMATTQGGGSIVSHTVTSATIARDTDGFFSLKVVWNVLTGTTTPLFSAFQADATGNRSITGDGTSHLQIAYLGTEIGTEVTTPILSNGTAIVTRAAEMLTGDVPWIADDSALSFGLEYIPLSLATTGGTVMSVTGQAGNGIDLREAGGAVSYYATAQGTSVAVINGVPPTLTESRTAVLTAAPNDFRLCVDGKTLGIDTGGACPVGLKTITLGSTALGSEPMPIVVQRLKYWAEPLTRYSAEKFSDDLSLGGIAPKVAVINVQPTLTVLPTDTAVTITLVLGGDLIGSRVNYRTINGTAIAGTDYAAVSGTLYITPGEVSQEVTILLGNRSLTEDRTFSFELYGEVDATVPNRTCVVTLRRVIPAGASATTKYDFGTGTTLSTDWSLTRSSPAMARNDTGVWVTVAANAPRNHRHAPGVSGLLLEGSAGEQRLFDSVDPGLAGVAATKTAITTEQTPTGSRQVQWRPDGTAAEHKLTGQLSAAVCDMPTGEFTLWAMVRPVNWAFWTLRVKGIDNIWLSVRYNISGDGTILTADSGAIGLIERDPWFPNWYRVGLYRTQSANAGVTAQFELIATDSLGSSSINGDPSQGIDLCHLQLEPAPGMSSPLVVQGAAAKTTRAADVLKANSATTWFKLASCTYGLKFLRLRDEPGTQRFFTARDTSATSTADGIGFQSVAGVLTLIVKSANASFPNLISATPTVAGTPTTAVVTVNSGVSVGFFHENVKVGQTNVSAGPSPVGVIRLDSTEPDGSFPATMLLQSFYHWNYSIPDADATLFSGTLQYVPPGTAVKPVVSVPTALSVTEGGFIDVPITKSGTGACQVSFATKAGTATSPADFTAVGPVTVAFTASETAKTVRVQTVADTTVDGSETFSYAISLVAGDVSCTLGNAAGTCTIQDLPRVSIPATASGTEGQTLNITITKAGTGACSVSYRTAAGTAALNADYTGFGPLTASFTATETTKVIPISILADSISDPGEKFSFIIEAPAGCTIGTGTCAITVLESGTPPPPPTTTAYDPPVTFAGISSTGVINDFGIGQTPYYVTSLADTLDVGTLKHALTQSNRHVIFEVGGRWVQGAQGGFRVTGSNLTISGETAPSPGIIIQGGDFRIGNGNTAAPKNVHFKHITWERGYDDRVVTDSDGDGVMLVVYLNTTYIENIWFDHCAILWTNDEILSLWPHGPNGADGLLRNVSFSNCIFAEPLNNPQNVLDPSGKPYRSHYKGGVPDSNHGYGPIVAYQVHNVDFQYCLFTDMLMRAPFYDANTTTVIANNIALNVGMGAHITFNTYDNPIKPFLTTVVGYLCISGPDSAAHGGWKIHTGQASCPTGSKAFIDGMYSWKGTSATITPYTQQQLLGTGSGEGKAFFNAGQRNCLLDTSKDPRPTDIPKNPVPILSADELYDRAKKNVGPRPKDRANSAVSVQKVITKLNNKTGKMVGHPSQVGGMSTLATKTRSLRNGTGKMLDGVTPVPAYPTTTTDKAAVRAWLEKFQADIQYD